MNIYAVDIQAVAAVAPFGGSALTFDGVEYAPVETSTGPQVRNAPARSVAPRQQNR
ncbi:hypothetical protein [Rhodococcus erythropolis]|uniref:hypothetical protein n=1 Tax=Rhodococcus erythropolis TaxID=1833 RepID=UPI001BEA07C3|nr:hypothetical protein [Rhodococcus erythropolis]MBT2269511.1 hypothetical protein [Rhodococcus erythropolis]